MLFFRLNDLQLDNYSFYLETLELIGSYYCIIIIKCTFAALFYFYEQI